MPTLHLSVTTAPESIWHAWPVVAAGGMSIGHKGLDYAASALGATMVDLFEDAKVREEIRAEFAEKTKGFVYKPIIPPRSAAIAAVTSQDFSSKPGAITAER